MPLHLVRQDITVMHVDAIVNAANTRLLMGGGVCGAIFRAAGARRMQQACDSLSPIRTGEAVATPGFDLPARFVIHTAGPVWQGGDHGEERLLRDCYHNALALALHMGCASVAFPLISGGIFGYPKAEALHVAVDEIRRFLERDDADLEVTLCVFDAGALAAADGLDARIDAYIDDHYVAAHRGMRDRSREFDVLGLQPPAGFDGAVETGVAEEPQESFAPMAAPSAAPESTSESAPTPRRAEALRPRKASAPQPRRASQVTDDVLADLDEPFNVILMRLIDAKGADDVDVYKRANISRKLFSKIRCGNGYMPGKKTVLALAIALRLDIDETEDLLACAGYALSHSVKFDVIVEFFIVHGVFDVFTINETLFRYDQPLLGQ